MLSKGGKRKRTRNSKRKRLGRRKRALKPAASRILFGQGNFEDCQDKSFWVTGGRRSEPLQHEEFEDY